MMESEKKMDEIEHASLEHIPMRSLSLRLARATIKMTHDRRWRIDKVNPTHDLIICLTGGGHYRIGEDPETITIAPGQAMLIPAYTRFRGAHDGGPDRFVGIAQHFTLDLYGRGDLISLLSLRRAVDLPDWAVLEPLARRYRESAQLGTTTLAQHHQFMVFLLEYLAVAMRGWKTTTDAPSSQDHLSVQIMKVAGRLSQDPLGGGIAEMLADVPYNPDYFRRAFKDQIGQTPQKFRELKRMEFAANRLGMGLPVKEVAAELGYADPYFFSRMFKRHLGASPSAYRERPAAE